jgi:predicted metalloprotease with PDZ domain
MFMKRRPFRFGESHLLLPFLLLASLCPASIRQTAISPASSEAFSTAVQPKSSPAITLAVDATNAARRRFRARLIIPVIPGELTLYYPKWIPGEHMPSGPINNLAGLKITAGGTLLAWQRDLFDMYSIHVQVPSGVDSIEVLLDYLAPIAFESYYSGSPTTTQLSTLDWNELLLYPKGWNVDELTVNASLRLPAGWKFGTALSVLSQSEEQVRFTPASLCAVVDSPVLMGSNFEVFELLPGYRPRHEIDIAADSAADLRMKPELLAQYGNLVRQASVLFGAHHYRSYHFLLTLSDVVPHGGLEHHESDESRLPEHALEDPQRLALDAGLLPHEFVHSWNGKYRRPALEATSDYQQPVGTDLVWVYEGLTSYLGDVLTVRSNLWSPAQYRDNLAVISARLDHLPGRTWRNLQDSANAFQVLALAPKPWSSWRRGWNDVYDEGELIWLWADVIVRQQSHGQHSLDDFCRLFFGGKEGAPEVQPYDLEGLISALNKVAPYDWRGFFLIRLGSRAPRAPLEGLEAAGWHLVYTDVPSEMVLARESVSRSINSAYSIGLDLKEDGTVLDSIEDMVAARVGIVPGMRVIAVNGQNFSADVWHAALQAGVHTALPLDLLVESGGYYSDYHLDYHGGEKYPHLERDTSETDLLDQIVQPVKQPPR